MRACPTIIVSYCLTNFLIVYGGICNYHLEQYEEALKHYDYALSDPDKEDDPAKEGDKDKKKNVKYVELYYHRGLSRACLMKFVEAIDDYNQALEDAKTQPPSQKLLFKIKF